MKKRLLFLLTLLIFSTTTLAGDFRTSNWGDSIEQVKKMEDASIIGFDEKNSTLGYKTTISTVDMNIMYIFTDNKLHQGAYQNTSSHMNGKKYIDDYKRINKLLTKKYGKPHSQEERWTGDPLSLKKDPSEWHLAISMGNLSMFTRWKTDNSITTNMVAGDNLKIQHFVNYMDKSFERESDKLEEEKDLNQL